MANITKEFLEEALTEAIDSFQVTPGSNAGDGYACIIYSVDVIRKGKSEKPIHLIVKCFPTHPGRQAWLTESNMFRKELLAYNILIPELLRFQTNKGSIYSANDGFERIIKPPFPHFYFGQAVDYKAENAPKLCENPLENCIVLPDLRKSGGFRLANRLLGFDLDHVKLVILAQAKLHALSWAYKQQTNTKSLNTKFRFLQETLFDGLPNQVLEGILESHLSLFIEVVNKHAKTEEEKTDILESMEIFRGKFLDVLSLYFCDVKQPSDPSINKDNILREPQEHNPNEEPWMTITHGDSWLNNMMFRYDEETGKPQEVLFIDLQLIREADPFVDLAYALYTSTNAELRQEHLEDLLKLYNLTFIQICEHYKVIPPTGFQLSEVRRRFHRAKALGMATAIQGLPLFLNDPNNAVDLDATLGPSQNEIGQAFSDMVKKVVEIPEFIKRVMGLLRELRTDGVI